MSRDDILDVAVQYPPDDCDRLVDAWPEDARRQLADLQVRVRHLEVIVHRLLNEGTGDGR